MRTTIGCATLALAASLGSTAAFAQSGEIKIWSWNIAASSLKATAEGFAKKFPDVKVTVEDLGNQPVFDKTLAGCAAGGTGLPDIVSIENHEAEGFWSQFPDCFANLKELGYTAEIEAKFPEFKRTELAVGDAAYAMPWDSGPVVMFYRRDFYEKAGVDPATIKSWDDFIAAGKKIAEANPGVVMSQADLNGDSEFFRMIGNEQGCSYFSADGTQITINQPSCVTTLDMVKKLKESGTISAANWDEKIQSNGAGKVATQMYGGWYEGTVRSNAPDQAGKWGVYQMPSLTADGPHAANLGGSSLAITAASQNKEAAFAFLNYSLGTNEGQITMLKAFGLVPSLISALDDPFVKEKQPYWGDQAVWVDILSTLPKIKPARGTPFQQDAESAFRATQVKYLGGGYPDAKAALDDAANQIASATGLPIAQ
ncbi:MAG TPA: ABC transporter substrate-binding protein [Mesorhizobium sp.]